jgi:hypothetical protein
MARWIIAAFVIVLALHVIGAAALAAPVMAPP